LPKARQEADVTVSLLLNMSLDQSVNTAAARGDYVELEQLAAGQLAGLSTAHYLRCTPVPLIWAGHTTLLHAPTAAAAAVVNLICAAAARGDYAELEQLVAGQLAGLARDASWLKSYLVASLLLGKEAMQVRMVLGIFSGLV
jgi:hypothetical protein